MRTLLLNSFISNGEATEPILKNMEPEGVGGDKERRPERKASACSQLHRIQEPELRDLNLDEEYDINKVLAEGCYARILLAQHRSTDTTVVLKAVYEDLTSYKDFSREFHYSYHLSPHPNILDSYNVTFRYDGCMFFAQEPAPLGDLAGHVRLGGLPPSACTLIAVQLASALDFMHSKELVHRDVKLENILVFAADYSKIKLCDFGSTRKEGTMVSKLKCNWLPFLPPEIYETIKNERYTCKSSSDSWQLGIVTFVCLTGCPPWQMADSIQDPHYAAFCRYQRRKTTKIPLPFKRFSPRALRMFRRLFEHKPEKRAPCTEVFKYSKDIWIESKIQTSNSCSQIVSTSTLVQERKASLKLYLRNPDSSRHSQENNKNKLNKLINLYGLDSTIDQKYVTQRVWEWVMSCHDNPEPLETEI